MKSKDGMLKWSTNTKMSTKYVGFFVCFGVFFFADAQKATRPCHMLEHFDNLDEIYGFPIVKWVAVTWLKDIVRRDSSPCNVRQGNMP